MLSWFYERFEDSYIEYECIVPRKPKPHKVIGSRRRYHDSTIPPLDFR